MTYNYLSSPGAFVPAYPLSNYRHALGNPTIPSFSGVSELQGSRLLDPASQKLCIDFFAGFKTPATLLAGTSFVALFALSQRVEDTSFRSRREIFLMRLYHVFSLLSLLLSVTTILGAESATTCLLCPISVPKKVVAGSVYQILQSTMNFEFLLTRWSFITSILCFLQSTCFRLIVEFELFFKRSRRTAGVMVASTSMGFGLALLGYLDSFAALSHWPSLLDMTKELGLIIWNSIRTDRHPLQIASLTCFSISLLALFKFMLPGSIDEDKLADHERFT